MGPVQHGPEASQRMTFVYITPQAWRAFVRLAQARAGLPVTWGNLTVAQATQLAYAGLLYVERDADRDTIGLSFTPYGDEIAERCVPLPS